MNQLIFDLFDFGQCRGGGEGAFDAGEIADVFLAECDLPVEQLLRTLELVVLVVERLHVLAERQPLIELQRDFPARLAVDVIDRQRSVLMILEEMCIRHQIVAADLVVFGVFRLAELFFQDVELVFSAGKLGLDEFLQAVFLGRRVRSRKKRGLFEHGADGGEGERRVLRRQIVQREGRGREHLVVPVDDEAGRGFLFHAGGRNFGEGLDESILVLCVQIGAEHLLGQAGREDDLARTCRTKAETAVQQPLEERCGRLLG